MSVASKSIVFPSDSIAYFFNYNKTQQAKHIHVIPPAYVLVLFRIAMDSPVDDSDKDPDYKATTSSAESEDIVVELKRRNKRRRLKKTETKC